MTNTDTEYEANLPLIDKIVTEDRIIWAINSFLPYKSPGSDNIIPAMLQYSTNTIIKPLCALFKASRRLKYIPKCWRNVKVIFSQKPGKKNYSLAENYRPISLTFGENNRSVLKR